MASNNGILCLTGVRNPNIPSIIGNYQTYNEFQLARHVSNLCTIIKYRDANNTYSYIGVADANYRTIKDFPFANVSTISTLSVSGSISFGNLTVTPPTYTNTTI